MRITEAAGGMPDGRITGRELPGPAVPRMVLGTRLRRLREAQFITLEEAAEAIRTAESGIRDMERGRLCLNARDISDLLTIYDVTDETERATMLALSEQANAACWWHAYHDVVPEWLRAYLALEQAASVIRSYEVQFMPGLLQTRDYARAVIALGRGSASEAGVERRVELRMRRQQILYGQYAPHVWAVIDEAALRRPVGGAATMRAQIEHLIAACDLPHITVQVLPFAAGGHAAAGGPVTIVRLPQRELPDAIYLEQLLSAQYPDEPGDVERYRHIVDDLVTKAEPSTRTRAVLRRILAEI